MTGIIEQHEPDWQRGYDAAMNARPYGVSERVKDQLGFARGSRGFGGSQEGHQSGPG
jgi:hypothetical protein